MSADVVRLSTATKPVTKVDPDVVRVLENLLARAKEGEFQGVLICTVQTDGAGSLVGCGHAYVGEGVMQNVHAAVGTLETLKLRFMNNTLEGLR